MRISDRISDVCSSELLTRIDPRRSLLVATLAMVAACAGAASTAELDFLIVLRMVQGIAGATLLISGQAILFWNFPAARQPILQAMFAMGSVVAPATAEIGRAHV